MDKEKMKKNLLGLVFLAAFFGIIWILRQFGLF